MANITVVTYSAASHTRPVSLRQRNGQHHAPRRSNAVRHRVVVQQPADKRKQRRRSACQQRHHDDRARLDQFVLIRRGCPAASHSSDFPAMFPLFPLGWWSRACARRSEWWPYSACC